MSEDKISLSELADRFEDGDFDMDFMDLSPEAKNALNAVMEKLSFLHDEKIITISTPNGNKGFFYDLIVNRDFNTPIPDFMKPSGWKPKK